MRTCVDKFILTPMSCFVSFLLQNTFSELHGKKDVSKILIFLQNFNFKGQIESCLSIWCDIKRKCCAREWRKEWTWSTQDFSRSHLMHHSDKAGESSFLSEKCWKLKQNEVRFCNKIMKREKLRKRKRKIWF